MMTKNIPMIVAVIPFIVGVHQGAGTLPPGGGLSVDWREGQQILYLFFPVAIMSRIPSIPT